MPQTGNHSCCCRCCAQGGCSLQPVRGCERSERCSAGISDPLLACLPSPCDTPRASCRRTDNGNALLLLRAREAAPRGRRVCASGAGALPAAADPRAALRGWAEGDFLRQCHAAYCNLTPPPRSTIAIAFSPDGALLASTQCAPHPRPRTSAGSDVALLQHPDSSM